MEDRVICIEALALRIENLSTIFFWKIVQQLCIQKPNNEYLDNSMIDEMRNNGIDDERNGGPRS